MSIYRSYINFVNEWNLYSYSYYTALHAYKSYSFMPLIESCMLTYTIYNINNNIIIIIAIVTVLYTTQYDSLVTIKCLDV